MNALAEYRAVQRSVADDAVARHADLVRRIAHHLAARLPASVEVDDLIQAGMIGLIEASRSYDPDQGASFETYASIRIRGSMIDEIRRGDWVPRSVHRRARDAAAAIRKIEQSTGRAAASTRSIRSAARRVAKNPTAPATGGISSGQSQPQPVKPGSKRSASNTSRRTSRFEVKTYFSGVRARVAASTKTEQWISTARDELWYPPGAMTLTSQWCGQHTG